MPFPHFYPNDELSLIRKSLLLRLDLKLCTPYALYSLRERVNLYMRVWMGYNDK